MKKILILIFVVIISSILTSFSVFGESTSKLSYQSGSVYWYDNNCYTSVYVSTNNSQIGTLEIYKGYYDPEINTYNNTFETYEFKAKDFKITNKGAVLSTTINGKSVNIEWSGNGQKNTGKYCYTTMDGYKYTYSYRGVNFNGTANGNILTEQIPSDNYSYCGKSCDFTRMK